MYLGLCGSDVLIWKVVLKYFNQTESDCKRACNFLQTRHRRPRVAKLQRSNTRNKTSSGSSRNKNDFPAWPCGVVVEIGRSIKDASKTEFPLGGNFPSMITMPPYAGFTSVEVELILSFDFHFILRYLQIFQNNFDDGEIRFAILYT